MWTWSPEAGSTHRPTMPPDARYRPGISIIVISSSESPHLERCLERFGHCWADAHAEVVVVHAGPRTELPGLAAKLPAITWIPAAPTSTPADLRRIGLERTSRDLALFLDDREMERHEWAAAVTRNWRGWLDTGRFINGQSCGDETESSPYPYLSVVMPVHNGGPKFLLSLEALSLSDLPRRAWELVIVDDGSQDETTAIAAQYADKLLRLRHGPRGPGYARNRGFELTLGECVAFINADVMVATDALRTAVAYLAEHPDIGAAFGSCDACPDTRGFLSDYRALVQRYYHASGAEDRCTFSSACGIVRSALFEQAGGYDEWHFSRRQLEDFELGQRIRGLGARIVPNANIRAMHLRKWTLRRMISTEIFDRTVPWMRLVKRQLWQDRAGTPGRRLVKNVNVVLSWLSLSCAVVGVLRHSLLAYLAAIACVAVMLANSTSRLAFFARERGIGFAVSSIPLDLFYYIIAGVGILFGWIARQALGEPTPGAVAQAFAEIGAKHWPPSPVRRRGRASQTPRPEVGAPPSPAADLPLVTQDAPSEPPSSGASQATQ
jgi:glycosyltransferase involved in cell wall biosynthesis